MYSAPEGVRFHWNFGAMDPLGSQYASFNLFRSEIEEILGRDELLGDTLSRMKANPDNVGIARITAIQRGEKYAVYHVAAGDNAFVLISPRRGNNEELRTEHSQLIELRSALEENCQRVFVPQPYAYKETDEFVGMSIEYLSNHFEINALTMSIRGGSGVVIYTNPYSPLLPKVEREYGDEECDEIRINMIARLYVVHKLLGGVPSELQINAGDFMGNPNEGDLDLKLTSIRGGLQRLTDIEFKRFLFEHKEPDGFGECQIVFPFFDDMDLIQDGFKKGEGLLKK